MVSDNAEKIPTDLHMESLDVFNYQSKVMNKDFVDLLSKLRCLNAAVF